MELIDTSSVLRGSVFDIKTKKYEIIVNKKYRTPTYFPRFVNLEEDFLRALYLFWGDGSYKEKLHFTNKEPELHSYILKMFEKYFGMPNRLWKLRIIYNERESNKSKNLKSVWLKRLGLNDDQLYPTIAISGYKSNENGNARIIIDKLTYCDFVRCFINHVNELVENGDLNEFQLTAILDGILNAEGSALIDTIGLHKIVITLHEKEIVFVRSILSQLNINSVFVEYNGKLIITEWRKLYKFIKLFVKNNICPFSLHKQRKNNCINGFLKHKRTVALYRYLSIIERNENISLKKLARITKRDPASAKVVIFKRLTEFTNISTSVRPVKNYKINLSAEGEEFLYVIRKLMEWR